MFVIRVHDSWRSDQWGRRTTNGWEFADAEETWYELGFWEWIWYRYYIRWIGLRLVDCLSCEFWCWPIYCLCCVCAKYFPFWFLRIKKYENWFIFRNKVLASTDTLFCLPVLCKKFMAYNEILKTFEDQEELKEVWPSNASKKADQWVAFRIYSVDIPFTCSSLQYLCCHLPVLTMVASLIPRLLFSSTNKMCFM